MINYQITPEEVASGQINEQETDKWLISAPARHLEAFILCKKPYTTRGNKPETIEKANEYIERAKIALNIRLAEDAANTVSKLIQHTEKLTVQTDRQIQYTERLTNQTDTLVSDSKALNDQTTILVAESKKLGCLTWALIWLTVVLAILTAGLFYIDWHREVTKP